MKYIFSFLFALSLGFLVGYQTEKPQQIAKYSPNISEKEEFQLPENIAFSETTEKNTMNINTVTTDIIPGGYGMYADFNHVLSLQLLWPDKPDADYLYLGVGTTEKSVQTKPWGDIYSGYVTGKTSITIALPAEWNNTLTANRIVYVRLWTKIGARWSKEDFSFRVSDYTSRVCDDTVDLVCGRTKTDTCIGDECFPRGNLKTFLNTCEMRKAGATMVSPGECGNGDGRECSKIYNPVCGQRYPAGCEAYILEASEKDNFDIPPKCKAIRETYTNTCEMRKAGATMVSPGECKNKGENIMQKQQYMCANAEVLHLAPYIGNNTYKGGEIMECEDGYTRVHEPKYTADLGDILFDEYFNIVARCGGFFAKEPEICNTIKCRPTGTYLCDANNDDVQCPTAYKPVCAQVNEKEKTFSNICEAEKANAELLHSGECEGTHDIPTQCHLWYDGCNTCEVKNGKIGTCTTRECLSHEVPRCLEYNSRDDNSIVCKKDGDPVCGVKYGYLKDYINACELYKDEADMFSHSTCDNTYRARLFEMTDGENNFIIKIDNPETIIKARNILAGYETEKIHITGIAESSPAEIYDNFDWNFHLKPSSIRFFSEGNSVCDISITELEDNIVTMGTTGLVANRWCPSDSTLIREIPGEYQID